MLGAEKGRLDSRLSSQSEQLGQVAFLVQAVVVHRMAVLSDFFRPSPVAERVRGDAEILGGFLDSEVTIEFFHLRDSQSGIRSLGANTNHA